MCYVHAVLGDRNKKSNEIRSLSSSSFWYNINGAKGNGRMDKCLQIITVMIMDIVCMWSPSHSCVSNILGISHHSQFQIWETWVRKASFEVRGHTSPSFTQCWCSLIPSFFELCILADKKKLIQMCGLMYWPVTKNHWVQTTHVMETISKPVSGPHWGICLEFSDFQIKEVFYFLNM